MTKRKKMTNKDAEHVVFGQADTLPAHKLPLQNIKLNELKMEMGEFFDVCSCACQSASCFQVHWKAKNCGGFHLACKCDMKIPKRKIQFLLD